MGSSNIDLVVSSFVPRVPIGMAVFVCYRRFIVMDCITKECTMIVGLPKAIGFGKKVCLSFT